MAPGNQQQEKWQNRFNDPALKTDSDFYFNSSVLILYQRQDGLSRKGAWWLVLLLGWTIQC